ncbi:MAG: N-acetylmuramoyl-L-alanine amidase, partial [Edaphobacter sp.]
MPLPLKHLAACLTLVLVTTCVAPAQQPRTTVLLDPAHGGPDTGAHLPNALLEKDIALAFAARLRAVLASSGFTVIATRDTDPTVPFTPDQRAEIANRARPGVCLTLHATSSGTGVHVVSSALTAPANIDDPHAPTPWD